MESALCEACWGDKGRALAALVLVATGSLAM